ncbi:unnamed protein product [Arabidopsis lyrata]|uniref:Uncharacterized protein n=1 Tax=Arabidopsis lyrata subsp. lyrata TaxID=81972 RepID=D7M8I2_ARALL|nr:defensin-like protein 210 [Arabidopsis lyrata subsp. lyrata]EFH48670.1 hypothetical protein ARALYDRAFT_327107 [Arabidopsis lyrata subsp. lyrata]CAH8272626.1 unnamed protein product [Arabidopsis lyrata]|eukprot:XP_002872411.1 defensin-like protein 210 [Arabidopsis lyrata subsp. lyrata]
MKKIILFLTFLVLSSSCTSIIIQKDNLEEKTYLDNPSASPIMDQILVDIHLGHSLRQGVMGFCYDCGKACFRRNKYIRSCTKFICRCSISDIK